MSEDGRVVASRSSCGRCRRGRPARRCGRRRRAWGRARAATRRRSRAPRRPGCGSRRAPAGRPGSRTRARWRTAVEQLRRWTATGRRSGASASVSSNRPPRPGRPSSGRPSLVAEGVEDEAQRLERSPCAVPRRRWRQAAQPGGGEVLLRSGRGPRRSASRVEQRVAVLGDEEEEQPVDEAQQGVRGRSSRRRRSLRAARSLAGWLRKPVPRVGDRPLARRRGAGPARGCRTRWPPSRHFSSQQRRAAPPSSAPRSGRRAAAGTAGRTR